MGGGYALMTNRRSLQRFLHHLKISSAGYLGIKLLLLLLGAGFALFALASFTSHSIRSGHLESSDLFPRTGYTILINTWKRYDLLKRSISHYASCDGVDSFHIVWSEPDPPREALVEYLTQVVKSNSPDGKRVELVFDINKEDSLNNRFKEIKDLKNDAVFSIDDDVIFPCSSVEFAFTVWRSAPDTMVGYVPRMHRLQKSDEKPNDFSYNGWWSVWWTGTYSMVLSKAAFFHKKYLALYSNELPSTIKNYVTKNRNCEDIAMSFLVANVSGAPPIWVKGKIFEIGSTGISSIGDHKEKRKKCMNKFVEEFGRMPLIPSSVKAVDSRTQWFW